MSILIRKSKYRELTTLRSANRIQSVGGDAEPSCLCNLMETPCQPHDMTEVIGITYPGKSKLVEMSGNPSGPYYTEVICWMQDDNNDRSSSPRRLESRRLHAGDITRAGESLSSIVRR